MSNIGAVIGWKFDHQSGMSTSGGIIIKFPGGIPSQSDQDAWTVEYETHLISVAYRENRRIAYGDVGDQLDMQYWDSVNDTTVWADHVAAVKAAHPKPE
jgi:hypothetical protein